MKTLQFESKMFKSGEYDEKNSVLTLEFTSGPRYEYSNFTAVDLEKFLNAESKGTHFARNIKGKFPYRKVGLI